MVGFPARGGQVNCVGSHLFCLGMQIFEMLLSLVRKIPRLLTKLGHTGICHSLP